MSHELAGIRYREWRCACGFVAESRAELTAHIAGQRMTYIHERRFPCCPHCRHETATTDHALPCLQCEPEAGNA